MQRVSEGMAAAGEMVTLPMDAFFQPLFYTFEGLLGDIRDRLENPNKIFGTWGTKKGPVATECMKGLGHLQAALQVRPALYRAARMEVFQDHLAKKAEFDAHAVALLGSFQGMDVITPTLVGVSPSIQVLFVRNVLAFLNAMETVPACQRPAAERVANFFTNNQAKVDEYKRDLAKYLADYNKRYGRLAEQEQTRLANTRAVIAGVLAPVLPPPGYGTDVATLQNRLTEAKTTAARFAMKNAAAAFAKYGAKIEEGVGQGGGRMRKTRRKHKKHTTRRHRKSRRHQ
jgi:hypothetical protein